MSKNHSHHSNSNLKVAFFLNFGFTILEIIGGLYTNSIAIISDALHDLGDSLSLGLSWWLNKYSLKPSDKKYSFGYKRFSLLGAVINSIVLIVGSFFVLSEAVPRIIEPQESNAEGMLVFAIIGILVNGAAVFRLRGGKSLNEKVITWHLLEDVLGWFAVLVTSIFLLFSDLYILDPILAVLITLFVLWNVIKRLRETLMIFLQGVPTDINLEELERRLSDISEVHTIHNTHIWSFDGENHVLTVHLVLKNDLSISNLILLKRKAKKIIRSLSIIHSTIEIEFEDEDCYMNEQKKEITSGI